MKKIIITLFLLFIGIFFVGFFNSIFVNPNLFPYHWDKILILFLTMLTMKKASDKNSIVSKAFHYNNQNSNTKILMSILVGTPILLSIFINISMPSIVHRLIAEETVKSVIINKKTNRSKRCLTYVYTTEKMIKGFCINKNLYNQIKVGDKLFLKGTLSPFGFTLDRVMKDNKTQEPIVDPSG